MPIVAKKKKSLNLTQNEWSRCRKILLAFDSESLRLIKINGPREVRGVGPSGGEKMASYQLSMHRPAPS